MTLIFIGAIIAVVGGVITAIGTLLQSKASSKQSDTILLTGQETNQKIADQALHIDSLKKNNDSLRAQVDILQGKSDSQLQKIETMTLQNAALSTELADAALSINANVKNTSKETNYAVANSKDEIKNVITGGDSFAIVELLVSGNSASVATMLNGNNMLTNLLVTIKDNDAEDLYLKQLRASGKGISIDDINNFNSYIKIETLTSQVASLTKDLKLPLYGNLRYFGIDFSANNGIYKQELYLALVGHKWLTATKVFKGPFRITEVYRHIDDGFPVDKIKW